MYCYCRSLLWKNLADGSDPIADLSEEFSDGEKYCLDWLQDYSVEKTLLYGVPFSILFVNWLSKTILRLMTRLEGYQSKPEEVYASAINMYIMAFINAGLTIQLVYF